jgi:hypothetical protein
MARHDDEELAALLAELERTLTDLRSAVGEDVRRRRRPPTPSDILRFTEEYTIPTLVALLDATARSLELLRAVLRTSGPRGGERARLETAETAESADLAALRRALDDLGSALGETSLPEDAAARRVLTDAQRLTDEIEERLAASGGLPSAGADWDEHDRERTPQRDRRRRADERGVTIDVREESAGGDVDVESELSSIKESMETDHEDEDRDE